MTDAVSTTKSDSGPYQASASGRRPAAGRPPSSISGLDTTVIGIACPPSVRIRRNCALGRVVSSAMDF